MGLGLAEPGFATACYVEIEDYPRQTLIAGQEAGYLHPAPIWGDLKRFVARPWAGHIDTLLAGYPCQPFSQAGQRRGEDDPRHLWPDIARIIPELGDGLEWCFFENVPGHITLGLETVLRELWGLGFTPAVGLFSAGETGAPHERQRIFIVAHRQDADRGRKQSAQGTWGGRAVPAGSRQHVDDAAGHDWAIHAGRRGQGVGEADLGGRGRDVGHSERFGRGEGRAKHGVRGGRNTATGPSGALADAGGAEREGLQPGQRDTGGRQVENGHLALCGRAGLFPPGPGDRDAWPAVLTMAPGLAPALALRDIARRAQHLAQMGEERGVAEGAAQSELRRMVDGLASRSRALRLLGNGVHPLAAAYAWRTLSAARGLCGVDLETPAAGRARA